MVRQHTCCPCCGEHDVRWLGKLQNSGWFAGRRLDVPLIGGDLYRCRRCQLKFRHPAHDDALYERLYDNAVISSWPADTERPDWDLIIGHIERRLPRGGRVLDFGCYTGGLLARLDSVYERYGVEVNRAAAAVAAESAQAQIWSRADDIPGNMRFDVVVAADVIEHMANPLDTMSTLMTLLTHDGILIVTTGDADNFLWNRFGANWWYCFYAEHVAFVSRAWVELAPCRQGWEILHCERFRYRRLGALRRLLELAFACAYGLRPSVYLYIGNLLRRWCGRRPISSVAGSGASADHLLIIARPDRSS